MLFSHNARPWLYCSALLLFSGCSVANTPPVTESSFASLGQEISGSPDMTCRNSADYYRKILADGGISAKAEWKKAGISELEAFAWMNDPQGIGLALSSPVDSAIVTKAIEAAATANAVNALEKMLDAEGIANENNLTAGLLSAAQCGNVQSVQSLIKRGARPNSTNEEGLDSVVASLVSRHFEVTSILLKAGYDSCAARIKNGKTVKALAESVGAVAISRDLPSCR